MPNRSLPRVLATLALALFAAACVNTRPKDSKVEMAPTPFTAEEIRDACPPGTVMVYDVETPDAKLRRTMRFFDGDAAGTKIESTQVRAETGEPVGQPSTRTHAWEELRANASFEAASTVLTEETVTVPAGTFETKTYHVFAQDPNTGSKQKQSYHFAPSLPGPPVLLVIEEQTGVRVLRMALVERR